jgi:hypothetical protein
LRCTVSVPVAFELSELGGTEEQIEFALRGHEPGAKEIKDAHYTQTKWYCEEKNPLAVLNPGTWRKLDEGRKVWYEIRFRANEISSSMVGLTHAGDILMMACRSPYSNRKGWTIERAAEHLKDRGAVDALLIDEGTDVFQCLTDAAHQLWPKRRQVRACFIFASKKPAQARVLRSGRGMVFRRALDVR